jgi:ribonuclease P protein component
MPRLVVSADFERVLGSRSRATTAHFAVHHLAGRPSARPAPRQGALDGKLSTIEGGASALPVEDFPVTDLLPPESWVGAVVPKRHARRAVTRSLIKRQIYAAAERHRARLAPGLWIVRLRSPFDRAQYPSAGSPALARSARAELEALLGAAAQASS